MNRRYFLTGVAAGVATALAPAAVSYIPADNSTLYHKRREVIQTLLQKDAQSTGQVWNMRANFLRFDDLSRKLRESIQGLRQ